PCRKVHGGYAGADPVKPVRYEMRSGRHPVWLPMRARPRDRWWKAGKRRTRRVPRLEIRCLVRCLHVSARLPLLDSNALSEIARLIDIAAAPYRDMVRQ